MTSLLELELEAKKMKLDQAEMRRGSDSPYVKEIKTLSAALEGEDNARISFILQSNSPC